MIYDNLFEYYGDIKKSLESIIIDNGEITQEELKKKLKIQKDLMNYQFKEEYKEIINYENSRISKMGFSRSKKIY